MKYAFCILIMIVLVGCHGGSDSAANESREKTQADSQSPHAQTRQQTKPKPALPAVRHQPPKLPKTQRTIHVFVALCDNDSQGIVPVSKLLGNGDDPRNNLYWGAMYGTKTFLRKQAAWKPVRWQGQLPTGVLERIILKHRTTGAYLVADAYQGRQIKRAVENFLQAAAGHNPTILKAGTATLGTNGQANLVAYVGHNGLMDFSVNCPARPRPGSRAAIVLACKTKPYFQQTLRKLKCSPMLLTTGFMAPEAYTLHAAVEAWLANQNAPAIRAAAAKAYSKYQKCSLNAAKRLFYTE